MKDEQLRLCDIGSPSCIFRAYLDDGDYHCNCMGMEPIGYQVVGEDSPDIDVRLAEVRWVDIGDVTAKDIPIPPLPAYIPTIPRGSKQLFNRYHPPIVAVKLGDVVSTEKLLVADSLEKRFGIPPGTKVLLQCYGKDNLLENLWPRRYEIFPQLAELGFYAATGVNYSVWDSQPHAERLINIKRAHLTYEDMQNLGMPAIPHIYWCGRVNLDAWLKWLADNPSVQVVAINMQTMRKDVDWQRGLEGLRYFVGKLPRPIHFLITGPQTPFRVAQIKKILPSMTLTNGYPARKAVASRRVDQDGFSLKATYSGADKSSLFKHNVEINERLLRSGSQSFRDQFLANQRKARSLRRQPTAKRTKPLPHPAVTP